VPLERQLTNLIHKINIAKIPDLEMLLKFDCGEDSVNNFLKDDALDKNRKNLFPTTVFYSSEDSRIVGYYSLTSSIVEVKSAYDVSAFKELGAYDEDSTSILSYPATEIAWLGVDRSYQAQSFGASILLDAFRAVLGIKYLFNIGTVGIEVDTLPGAVEFYQRYGFSYLHMDYDNVMAMPETYPMFVAMDDLEAIVKELDK